MIRRLFAATVLLAALAAPATLLAQAEAPIVAGADEGGGSPIWGYLAFGALGGLALMILCRSSRRT